MGLVKQFPHLKIVLQDLAPVVQQGREVSAYMKRKFKLRVNQRHPSTGKLSTLKPLQTSASNLFRLTYLTDNQSRTAISIT